MEKFTNLFTEANFYDARDGEDRIWVRERIELVLIHTPYGEMITTEGRADDCAYLESGECFPDLVNASYRIRKYLATHNTQEIMKLFYQQRRQGHAFTLPDRTAFTRTE
jgi:hypothetical protein